MKNKVLKVTTVRTAMKGSILKWQGIVDGTKSDLGSLNCPLCKLFFDNNCAGCPVAIDTGETSCRSTPYEDYIDCGETKSIAKCELSYLKGVYKKFFGGS